MGIGAKIFAACIGLALVGLGSFWLGTQRQTALKSPTATAGTIAKPAQPIPATNVETADVTVGALPQAIEAVGSLRSDESVMLRPEVSGRVAEILFREGQRVTQGATLVRFDDAVQRAELQQAEANLALSRSKFERAVDLQRKGFISAQARDEADNTLKIAEAAYRLAVARLGKLEIKAPFSGTIGLRAVSVGDYVREGQDIANIEELDLIKVDFRIPEIFVSEVVPGLPVEVALDAFTNQVFEGKIAAINPLLDANGRSLVVRAVVKNKEAKLRPGMFARVRLITKRMEQAKTIPEQALMPQGDDFYVFRVVQGLAQRTKVEIGQRRQGNVQILTGLEKSDRVITAGHNKIRDGAPVNVTAPRSEQAETRLPAKS